MLADNYVEDDEGSFRFDYSIPFIRWAICPPKYKPKWHVGVRVTKSKKLVGFIAGMIHRFNTSRPSSYPQSYG